MDSLKKHFNKNHKLIEIQNKPQWEERYYYLNTMKQTEYIIIILLTLLASLIVFETQYGLQIVLGVYVIVSYFFGSFYEKIERQHKDKLNTFLIKDKLIKAGIKVTGILDYEKEMETIEIKESDTNYISDKLENIYFVLINHKVVPYTFIKFKKYFNEFKGLKSFMKLNGKEKQTIKTNIELGYKIETEDKELYMYQISTMLCFNNKVLKEKNLLNGFIFLMDKPNMFGDLNNGIYIDTDMKKEDSTSEYNRKQVTKSYIKKIYDKNKEDSKKEHIEIEEVVFDLFDKEQLIFNEEHVANIKGGLDFTINNYETLDENQKSLLKDNNINMIEVSDNHLMLYYEINREEELFFGYDNGITLEDNIKMTILEMTSTTKLIKEILKVD